jgi:hypothetical protein
MFTGSSSGATRNLFDTMPGAQEVFGEMSGAHMIFTDEEGTTIMNDMIGGGHTGARAVEVEASEDKIREIVEFMDASTLENM